MLSKHIDIGSLVSTSLGEGFLVGRTNAVDQPNYDVRLFDGRLAVSWGNSNGTVITSVELIDPMPIDHPKIPPGMRRWLLDRAAPPSPDNGIVAPPKKPRGARIWGFGRKVPSESRISA